MKSILLSTSLLVGTLITRVGAEGPTIRTTLILVQGAAGEPEYAAKFATQLEAWKTAGTRAGAETLTLGGNQAKAPDPDRTRLEKILAEIPHDGPAGLWLVLIGHGTWDGKEARFNLDGPDLSATDLAHWLRPVKRPVTVINTSSSSAPFMPLLAAPNRTVITATRSGNERNYARFGEYLAATLTDPAADYDQDGSVSLLEWFLRASSRTTEFYLSEGRLVTEHAVIDDNGDGKGTPAEWFRGLRATTKTKDKAPLDGRVSQQRFLAPDSGSLSMTTEQLTLRDELENGIAALRERKATLTEDEYFLQLEVLLRRLADLHVKP